MFRFAPVLFLACFAVLGALTLRQNAFAACNRYAAETGASLDSTISCRSSLGRPGYEIVQHLYDGPLGSVYTTFFSFAPRSRGLVCHRYDVGSERYEKCRSYGPDFFPKKLGRKVEVKMVELSTTSARKISTLYGDDSLYRYPDNASLMEVENCLTILHTPTEMTIGYREDALIDLADCLIKFEQAVTQQKLFQ